MHLSTYAVSRLKYSSSTVVLALLFATATAAYCRSSFTEANASPAQTGTAGATLAPEIRERVPAELRPLAEKILRVSAEDHKRILSDGSDSARARILRLLVAAADETDAMAVLNYLEREPSAWVRREVKTELPSDLRGRPWARKVVEKAILSEPDVKVVEAILAEVRIEAAREIGALLTKRVEAAQAAGHVETLRALGRIQERVGSHLPGFMWEAPPKFDVKARDGRIRVLAIGDFGLGDDALSQGSTFRFRNHAGR